MSIGALDNYWCEEADSEYEDYHDDEEYFDEEEND